MADVLPKDIGPKNDVNARKWEVWNLISTLGEWDAEAVARSSKIGLSAAEVLTYAREILATAHDRLRRDGERPDRLSGTLRRYKSQLHPLGPNALRQANLSLTENMVLARLFSTDPEKNYLGSIWARLGLSEAQPRASAKPRGERRHTTVELLSRATPDIAEKLNLSERERQVFDLSTARRNKSNNRR